MCEENIKKIKKSLRNNNPLPEEINLYCFKYRFKYLGGVV